MDRNTHPEIDDAVRRYLAAADRLLPGAVTAAALGGSVALGAYRPGASDIDMVAALDDAWRGRPDLVRRLRLFVTVDGEALTVRSRGALVH
ncbi:nucleotidyltransferase domain-containing protein, partial [Tsukamurella tyrosinosolvens]|uniref:nucleotidyltransferase domain-containing protein n=1 Tax=Tsukamurella tyrosinosolvens TaxID=57704 RepID=UPI00247FB849